MNVHAVCLRVLPNVVDRRFFFPSFLSRSYALQNTGVKVIWDAGNEIFRRQLEQLPEVLLRITAGLLASVESHRYVFWKRPRPSALDFPLTLLRARCELTCYDLGYLVMLLLFDW